VTNVANSAPQRTTDMDDSWQDVVREDDFSAEASVRGQRMEVALSGTADFMMKGHLDRFLRALHAETQRRALDQVNVDVRQLEFMNSSCLQSFAWWIRTVQEQPAEGRYRVVFLSSPTVYWQRRSLSELAGLAGDLISVQS
jgi:hypothetical protein